MALKPSSALLAAMIVIAAPAFAQDAATPPTDASPDSTTATTGTLPPAADAPSETNPATEAPTDAGTAATEADATGSDAAATTDTAPDATGTGTEATGSAPTGADAAAESTTAAPTDGAAPENDAAAGATATGTTTGEAAPADAATAPDPNAEPQVGAYYVKSTHDDWLIRCIKAPEGVDPCELYQLMRDDTGNSVAEVTLIPLEGGEVAAGATVVVPLETDLTFGLNFQVDQGRGRVYPFNFCAPVGCVARIGFPDADLAALRRGNVANVALLPFGGNPEDPVRLELSLTGFTAGYEALQDLAVAEPAGAAAPADSADAETPASDAAPAAESETDAEPTADGADAPSGETAPAN